MVAAGNVADWSSVPDDLVPQILTIARWPASIVAVGVIIVAVARARRARSADEAFAGKTGDRFVEDRSPSVALAMVVAASLSTVVTSYGWMRVLGREYRDGYQLVGGHRQLLGALIPPFLWTVAFSAASGLLGLLIVSVVVRRSATLASIRASATAHVGGFFSAAILWRLWMALAIIPAKPDGGDPFYYHATANLLVRGQGFLEPVRWTVLGIKNPGAVHGPLYPMVLALSSRVGGTSYFDHRVMAVLIGGLVVPAVYIVANRVGGRRVAIVATCLAVVYPNLWSADGSLFVESMMAALTTLATYVAYRWIETPRRRLMVLIGVLLGLAALTRGEGILLVPILVIPLVLVDKRLQLRQRWTQIAIGGLACLVTISPWMIYNASRFEVFVPLSTNSNEVLYYANCPDVYSGRLIGFWSYDCQVRHIAEFGEAPGDQAQQSEYWRSLAFHYVGDHLGQLPTVIAARVGRQWEVFRPYQTVDFSFIESRNRTSVEIGLIMYYLLMAGTLVSFWILRRRGTRLMPLTSHFITVTLTAAYAYGTLRFRITVEPILCVGAAISAVALVDRLAASRHQHVELPADRTTDEPVV